MVKHELSTCLEASRETQGAESLPRGLIVAQELNVYLEACSCLENSWKEDPRGLQPLGSHRVRIDSSEGHDVQHRELYWTLFNNLSGK